MIPESTANRTVSLYRADPFPSRWVHEAVLIEGVEASDATLVQHGGRFWLFAATRDHGGSWSDTLSIFMAPTLRGPWRPHPANPILIDSAAARPAGAMFHQGGRLWRPVQNCSRGYGTGIGFAEVTQLDGEGFAQVLRGQMAPDPAWPGRRLHTFNRAGGFDFIDGSAHAPRSATMARLLEPWTGRRGTL